MASMSLTFLLGAVFSFNFALSTVNWMALAAGFVRR